MAYNLPQPGLAILTAADYVTSPWKNGGGETTEIARAPHPDGGAEFAWRLSTAPIVADGPFSTYADIDRTTTIILGRGLVLTFADGNVRRLAPLEPQTFDGGLAAMGRLIDGSVRAFNVMTARGLWQARVRILERGEAAILAVADGALVLAHGLAGACTLALAGKKGPALAPTETAVVSGPASLAIGTGSSGQVLVAELMSAG